MSTSPLLPHALDIPAISSWKNKRVVLASASPRRREILETMGVRPEIIPSTFKEDLPKSSYSNAWADYPVATAGEKALEVYERLVREDDKNAPDLVIGADTVIIFPPQRETREELGLESIASSSVILEKPLDKADHARMLDEMNGKSCEVVTGAVIVYPIVAAPGYRLQSISTSTLVTFNDNPPEVLRAYVENGEGIDRAGGFAIQGLGSMLVSSIEGDYNNVVGFPSTPFWRWIGDLVEEDAFGE